MSPEQLHRLHPRLFHLTAAGSVQNILKHGLFATTEIVDRWDVREPQRATLLTSRRPQAVQLDHPQWGTAVINDNVPLHEGKLAKVLTDGLIPAQWLRMLNDRTFFFASDRALKALIGARLNRNVAKDVLVIETLSFARSYCDRMEIVPINSGNTMRKAATRGLSTFAPIKTTDYDIWRRQRRLSSPDTIKEVAVRGSIPDLRSFVIEVVPGGHLP
jgi:hypothetical protein